MTCRSVTHRLGAYLDGELPPRQQAELDEHLASCSQCRAQAAALRHAEDALRMLRPTEPAPDLLHDLRRRLAAPSARSLRLIWAGGAAVAVAAAGLILLLLHPPTAKAPRLRTPASPPYIASKSPPPSTITASRAGPAVAPRPVVAAKPMVRHQPRPRRGRHAPSSPGESPGGEREQVPVPAESEPRLEPEAAEAVLTASPAPLGGVIVLLGEPAPALPSSSCYLEVSFPDGAKSVTDRTVERDAAGRPRAVQIAYENTPPEERATN